MSETYDALLFLSFGGPEGMDDVLPFLENVVRGRNVPRERLVEVGAHYKMFNGVSPINAQNRALIAALETELTAHDIELPVYFGNRNWHPLLEDTMRQMKADGVQRALTFVTSTWSSYSSCRQYRENIAQAQEAVGEGAPTVDKLRHYFNHPGFIGPMAEHVASSLATIPASRHGTTHLALTAHSIPMSMARTSRYQEQLEEAGGLVASHVAMADWQVVYQSRSGPPHIPWLEPDICDHLDTLKARGITDVIVSPIGFISDHVEVMFDLDTEARQHAEDIGLRLLRAGTVGTHPDFVAMIRELVEERIGRRSDRRALGTMGPSWDVCPLDCCPPGKRTRPKAA